MPSGYTTRNRLEKQAAGENSGTWGLRLNTNVIDMVDEAIDGIVSFTLSTTKTLSTANGATDESRPRVINITGGTGGTVTIQNTEKSYLVRNGSSGAVIFTTGSGTTATVASGDLRWIVCVGSNTIYNVGAAQSDLWGVQEIPIPATAMTPRLTNGPAVGLSETTTNKVVLATLDFDSSTAERAQIRFPMPKRWNESTVTAQFEWTAAATGDVVWGCRAVAISNDDPVDAAFGTGVTVTDSVTAANDFMVTAKTSAITIGGTPAEGDMVIFEFYRDAASGSDTLNSNDAKLLAAVLTITTNARDDS